MTEAQRYFIKGDISGIQEFIFNVKSEKAARVLKARSIYIQVLADVAERFLMEKFSKKSYETFFNGGGSFYGYLKDHRPIEEVKKEILEISGKINSTIANEDLYMAISVSDAGNSFKQYWNDINQISSVDKALKYSGSIESFHAYSFKNTSEDWKEFAQQSPKSEGAKLIDNLNSERLEFEVYRNGINHLGSKLKLGKTEPKADYFKKKIYNVLPTWSKELRENYRHKIDEVLQERRESILGDNKREQIRTGFVIDYQFLAHFSGERTGTEKLGILKLDVDNLGLLFENIEKEAIASKLSEELDKFFGVKLNELLGNQINYNYDEEELRKVPDKFGDNIYTVFAGGDDCFFVGGWDAIFEWSILINKEFTKLSQKLHSDFTQKLTVSAGLVVVDPKYPVVRFAELAEDAIDQAKSFKYVGEQIPEKNKVSIFNQVLTWKEFEQAQKQAYNLKKAIEQNRHGEKGREIRSLLRKLQDNSSAFQFDYERAESGNVEFPSVWKLFYASRSYFRGRNNNPDLLMEEDHESRLSAGNAVSGLINAYYASLINVFAGKRGNPMKFPVIARWAEFLTRKPK